MSSDENFNDALLQTLDRIEASQDKFAVFECLSAYSQNLGFTYATIGQLVHPSLQDMPYADLGVSNYPKDFQENYISNNHLLHDPVIGRALISQDPFSWTEVIANASKRGREVMEESRQFDMAAGYTVPVHMPDRTPGIVSFAGDICELAARDKQALNLASYHAYSRLLDIYESSQQVDIIRLSPREVDVLHHIACGRADAEIAFTLNISLNVVKDHASNARRKLGAKNRAHAVMIAIRDGHISL